MKDKKTLAELIAVYQDLIGKIIFSAAIIIAACILGNAITETGLELHNALGHLSELIRDGLLQLGSAA